MVVVGLMIAACIRCRDLYVQVSVWPQDSEKL